MRVMVIVKANQGVGSGDQARDEKLLKEMGAFNEELVKAASCSPRRTQAEASWGSGSGSRARPNGIDGPFTEDQGARAGYCSGR